MNEKTKAVGAMALLALGACSSSSAPPSNGLSFDAERDRVKATVASDICREDSMKQVGGGSGRIRSYTCSVMSLDGDTIGPELFSVLVQEESGNAPERLIYTAYLSGGADAQTYRPSFEKLVALYGLTADKLAACASDGNVRVNGAGFFIECTMQAAETPPGIGIWIERNPI